MKHRIFGMIAAVLVMERPDVGRAADYALEQFDYKGSHEKRDDAAERLRCYKEIDDDQAGTGKALSVALNKSILRKGDFTILSVPPLTNAAPGLYRMTVRMKMQGMLNTLGTAIRLDAQDVLSCTVYPNEFDDEDTYKEFSLDFEVRPAALFTLPPEAVVAIARRSLNVTNEPTLAVLKSVLEAHPGQELAEDPAGAPELPLSQDQRRRLNQEGRSPSRIGFSLVFPQTSTSQGTPGAAGSRGVSSPDSSLRKLIVDRVRIEKVPEPQLVVREVRAKCAWRRPGESQKFDVWLHNRTGQDKTAQVRLTVRYGLDGALVLGEKPLTLKNGAYQTLSWNWDIPADQHRYGHEAEAEVIEGGKVVASNRTWFTVHPKVTAVMIPLVRSPINASRYHDPYAPLPRVENYDEFWAPTPYDSAGLVPEDPSKPFARGNSGGFLTLAELAERARQNREDGIASFFYLEGHGTGCKAWDVFFDRPEQTVYANIQTEEFYLKRQSVLANDYPKWKAGKLEREPAYPHTGFVMYNGLYKEPVDRVIQGSLELSRRVGFEGIRWDSCSPFQAYNTTILGNQLNKSPEDLVKAQRDNFARYARELREKIPTFEWRMNGGIGALMNKPEDPFDFAKARQIIDRDFHKVFLADDGGIEEENWGHSYLAYGDYKNICLNYLRATRYESAAYKYAGGHHAHMHSYNGGMNYTPDDFYKQAFTLLGGAHMDYCNYAPTPESDLDLGLYAARFGEFFWDPRLTPLEKIGDKVSLNTQEDLWYTEAGFEKDTERGTHLYILPIINPPVTERWLRNRFGQLPAPVRHPIGVTVKLPAGYAGVKAVYLLDNSPYPAVRPLAFKVAAGSVSYEIPELMIFKVAAVEFSK